MINKKGDTRFLYIFIILGVFGLLSFLYVAIGNTLYNVNGENPLTESTETYTNNNPLLPDNSETLFDKVVRSYEYMPEWVNWLLALLVFILGLLLYSVIVH